ncbi:MAG: BamA/TamA family outer membrane protein [Bacteroidota bacterium]|nr:BamA/TamA family outer membrane protein [Bacteroidota bacterium]
MVNNIFGKIFIATVLFLPACNTTKLVPKGDALYTGATVKVADSTLSKKEKNKVLDLTDHLPRPAPNSKFLGIPFKLFFFNLAGDPKKKGFIRKFLRKIGQPPVLLSSVNIDYNAKVLQNYQQNIGYFDAQAAADTVVKNKKGHAIYTLTPGPQYTIQEVQFDVDSSALGRSIKDTRAKSLLHPGDPFNLETIKIERERIDAILKEEGYYYFSPDLLIINADSTVGVHKVNMHLLVKERTPSIAKKPYIIDDVYIYPNYRINGGRNDTSHINRTLYDGYYIVDPAKKFKPQLFPRILRFDSGDVYNRTDHNLTLARLINLDVFKFVNNRFENSPNSEGDTGRLNTYYYLTALPKKSLRAEISGNTKSNNYVGSLITFTFRNRNIFRAAEHLDVHANVGSEVQYSGSKSGYNTYTLGGGLTFRIPKFVVPFFKFNTTNAFVPSTKIELSYDLLNRVKLYTLNSFTALLGYTWKPNIRVQQDFNPFVINYVKALNVTQKYIDSIASNPVLKHAIDTQFVIGSNYAYTIDPLINNPYGTGFYFNGQADLSGNIAGVLIKADAADGKKRLFGTQISQYIKTQLEGRYYYAFSTKTRLANRIIFGVGYPYGNSREMPFIKQFFIGGNNSIRAFRSRSIGPGTYRDPRADSLSFFPDESGDIKLEMNTELRLKINNIIEGAVFVDAGNIWLYNKDSNRPGGEFTKNFLNQLAIGTGVGLRLNLTILLLRIDLATPVREPWLTPGNQWVLGNIDFSSKTWRRQNLVLNLAIGYPF